MSTKIWYEIYVTNVYNERTLAAKVKSQGLAVLIASSLEDIYSKVEIR